jgi:type IV secretion system protein VirD4
MRNPFAVARLMLVMALAALAYGTFETVVALCTLYPMGWWIVALAGGVGLAKLKKIIGRPSGLSAFGTASWADPEDLAAEGMLGGKCGIILGHLLGGYTRDRLSGFKALLNPALSASLAVSRYFSAWSKPGEPLVRMPNAVHSVVFAPAGAGKSTGIAIPFLLDGCPDESTVVIDLKGELALATAAARARMGQRIVVFDPYHIVTGRLGVESDTFNPLDFFAHDSALALDDCNEIAQALVVRTGEEKEPHWVDSAEKFISAVAAIVVATGEPGRRSLQEVAMLLSHPQLLDKAIDLMLACPLWDGLLARRGSELLHFVEKERGSVLTTCGRFLGFLSTPAMAAVTRESTFDPAYLKRGKTTVYLVLPPERMKAQMGWLRLMVGSMIRGVIREGLYENPRVHFVLDEAASLGQTDCLEDLVDKYRGYGCRAQFYYQSAGQLKKCWPKDEGQTLLSNTSKIFFGVNDVETARLVSETAGKYTQIVTGGGSGNNGGWNRGVSAGTRDASSSSGSSGGWSENSNWDQRERELLKVDEVMTLSPRVAITFPGLGMRPILSWMIRHYESGWRSESECLISPRVAVGKSGLLFAAGAALCVMTQALKESVAEGPRRVDPGVAINKRVMETLQEEKRRPKAAKRWEPPLMPVVISPRKRGGNERESGEGNRCGPTGAVQRAP